MSTRTTVGQTQLGGRNLVPPQDSSVPVNPTIKIPPTHYIYFTEGQYLTPISTRDKTENKAAYVLMFFFLFGLII